LTLVFLSASSMAYAESGTPKEQDACRPDVRRFCDKVDPNGGDDAFLACLEMNRNNLTPKCLAVLVDHGR
jgi:hypothetical protein